MTMQLSKRDRILLSVIVVVAALFGFYKFALTPAHRQASRLDAQIVSARASLSQAEAKYAQGRAAADGLHKGSATWAAAQRAVPASSNIPGLLRLLAREAHAAHVNFKSIALSGGATAPAPAATGSSPAGSSSPSATEIPVTLEIDGGYQAVNRLVRRLNGLVTTSGQQIRATGPLIGIDNVTLSGAKSLTFNLTVTIYQHASSASVLGPSSQEGAS